MAVKVIGLDTAKNVFQCMEQMEAGERCCEKDSDEARVPDFFANLPRCVVGIEATQGAHYWSRDRIVRPRGSANRPLVCQAVFDRPEE